VLHPDSDPAWLRRRLLSWFRDCGRSFPWRDTTDPYVVLIAELLLQRTRADLVEPVFNRFIASYPDACQLARADPIDVVELLRPLGFLHRSARLPGLARALVEEHGGRVPKSFPALMDLPGVGRYVANAVLALAFKERRPLLDPSVLRVLARVFGRESPRPRPRDDEQMWAFVDELSPRRGAREFNLALVDLGAIVCRRRRPRCYECPLQTRCRAFAEGTVTPAAPAPPPGSPITLAS
jgi:A/G-specific adenine glycosylase